MGVMRLPNGSTVVITNEVGVAYLDEKGVLVEDGAKNVVAWIVKKNATVGIAYRDAIQLFAEKPTSANHPNWAKLDELDKKQD